MDKADSVSSQNSRTTIISKDSKSKVKIVMGQVWKLLKHGSGIKSHQAEQLDAFYINLLKS